MNTSVTRSLLALLALGCASFASAETVLVYPGDSEWTSFGENGGGGSSTITNTAPHSGNASIEMQGDRTRFVYGSIYDSSKNLGMLYNLTAFTFDWSIATDSVAALNADYTPALRLHIWDGQQRSELIWEGAYNDTYGNTTKGTWYTSGVDDNFWQNKAGLGDSLIYDKSISDWQGVYSNNAYISAISVGVGSSAGAGYHAFADNISLTFQDIAARGLPSSGNTTFNFETKSSSVPDSGSTLALFAVGLLATAGLSRRFARR